jgi:predicted MFS family arabinose efflux permease
MLGIGVIYTPQAAGTAALIVPVEKRGSTIAYIFLGWSLAAAIGLPLISFVASRYGWQVAYAGIGAGGVLSFLLLAWQLPRKLYAAPVALRTWIDLGRNRLIILLLSITVLQMSGQFTIFTFMGPLLKQQTGARPASSIPGARTGPPCSSLRYCSLVSQAGRSGPGSMR